MTCRSVVFTPEIEEKRSSSSTVQNESRTSQTRTHIEKIRSSSSTVQDESSPSTVQNELPPSSLSFEKPRLLTANRISSAIEASERTQIYISMAVALLVVFAHFGFPLLGSKMVKTLLGFRPVYLVLVTNVTLVLARIFDIGPQRLSRVPARFGDCQNLSGTEYEWAKRLGVALGIGLKGNKVLDALFMVSVVYAIIVVLTYHLVCSTKKQAALAWKMSFANGFKSSPATNSITILVLFMRLLLMSFLILDTSSHFPRQGANSRWGLCIMELLRRMNEW
ncbi:hypothetical protein DVH24_020894 [Malus domestica]|uniref:Uncharacterized protein n=1 Tax=Malus domestica TaxID=3750 RepID=A0A498JET1_MALDO|nr:hypothetical protein DVH24_020894 [Malus domestica]